jgi:hypothetical protein
VSDEHEALIRRLTIQVRRGHYVGRTEAEWLERLTEPEVLGAFVHDMVKISKTADLSVPNAPGRTRRDFVREEDIVTYLPPVLRLLLPGALGGCEPDVQRMKVRVGDEVLVGRYVPGAAHPAELTISEFDVKVFVFEEAVSPSVGTDVVMIETLQLVTEMSDSVA